MQKKELKRNSFLATVNSFSSSFLKKELVPFTFLQKWTSSWLLRSCVPFLTIYALIPGGDAPVRQIFALHIHNAGSALSRHWFYQQKLDNFVIAGVRLTDQMQDVPIPRKLCNENLRGWGTTFNNGALMLILRIINIVGGVYSHTHCDDVITLLR